MSRNINVNPGHYKVAGRERQGEDILQQHQKQLYAQQPGGKHHGDVPPWEATRHSFVTAQPEPEQQPAPKKAAKKAARKGPRKASMKGRTKAKKAARPAARTTAKGKRASAAGRRAARKLSRGARKPAGSSRSNKRPAAKRSPAMRRR